MNRYWLCDLNADVSEHVPHLAAFGVDTVGVVDESAGGIIAYAHRANARAIVAALMATEGDQS